MAPVTAPGKGIRRATLADVETLANNNIRMAKETENFDLPREKIVPGVQAVIEDEAKGLYFVSEDASGAVVAQLMITFEWSDWRNQNCWWIQSVYTEPEHRRQGHFKALYEHVKQEAKACGACGLRLYADNDNARAHDTYKSLGMTSHYKVFESMFTDY